MNLVSSKLVSSLKNSITIHPIIYVSEIPDKIIDVIQVNYVNLQNSNFNA